MLAGYSYVRPLGSGGFADVFLYEQDMPRRVVAVKVLVDDAINPEVLRIFNAETDILARLSAHPSIVTIYQASISGDGRPYFVMEYCPDSMGTRYKKTPLPVTTVLDVGVRLASALETAHRSGVLHRDIKPSNVLVTTLGVPVLADFGIAAAVTPGDRESETLAMSVPWSAPEVLQNKTSGTVASEIWGLGATLYTLLARRAPFELPSGERIPRDQHEARIIKEKYVPTGRDDIPERLEAALVKTLDKDPAKRHATMLELAEELRWAQYEIGVAPTALDIVDPSWASAALQADDSAFAQRGPVISTVNHDSRRAQRAQALASAQRGIHQSEAEAGASSSSRKSAVWGAVIGATAVAVIVGVVVLVMGL